MLDAYRLPELSPAPRARAWLRAATPLLLATAIAIAEDDVPQPLPKPAPVAAAAPAADAPPRSELVVTIGGKDYPCRADGSFTADIDGKAITVSVREKPTKTFDYRGVRFEFPKAHAFESQIDAETAMWTLDGNDNVLIVLKPTTDVDRFFADYVAELRKNYADQTVVEKECRQRFGTIEATGTRLTVTLDITSEGTTLCQEVYLVKDEAGHGVIVMIQDSLDGENRQTSETSQVKKLFADTFAFHDEAEVAPTASPSPSPLP